MSWVKKRSTGGAIPDDALLFFNATTKEYYIITMAGEILIWST